ncbi:MAG: hypothetical protein ACE149_01310 [Armatimonadota bacterium]
MKLLRREKVWIHTHFITDCTYLPDHFAREIARKMDRLLEKERIVFGIHYDSHGDEGLRIVLECIPLPETMARIEQGLAEIISSIPARPRKTAVQVEPPQRGAVVSRR